MKANCKSIWSLLKGVLFGCLVGCLLTASEPFIGGLYYGMCGDRVEEQVYLDQCITHLKLMRAICDDPDLQGILDYTIRRYNKIGAWDVMIFPLTVIPQAGGKVVGCNDPFCPGITLDTLVLLEPPQYGALIVLHEAMHDYWPFYGHAHIMQREIKFFELSKRVRPQPYPVFP